VKKDTLFINGFLQDIEMDYAMALTKGNFIAFYGRNTKDVGTTLRCFPNIQLTHRMDIVHYNIPIAWE
jgi:hypothetical protein